METLQVKCQLHSREKSAFQKIAAVLDPEVWVNSASSRGFKLEAVNEFVTSMISYDEGLKASRQTVVHNACQFKKCAAGLEWTVEL